MKPDDFPTDIQPYIVPEPKGELFYKCLGCSAEFSINKPLYVCPDCEQILLIHDRYAESLKKIPGKTWQKIFDFRKVLKAPAFKGIYRYHEFIGSCIPESSIVYLGEGNTPVIEANERLQEKLNIRFFYKNDGQNPSGSFKDRGMASALSNVKYLLDQNWISDVIAVCASTGDTSAAAALYASYLQPHVKSAVLLPHNKVTPQQLSQPLGSGAQVFEIPGVFDDCMKIVEDLSEKYSVVLLNSKNPWRILGQESYAYEIAQDFDYHMDDKVIVVPIGNAGNISAIMNGFLKFFEVGIIKSLPKIIGIQSEHADPVFRYYQGKDENRKFKPVKVKPSVAQAAMIGNPVSMPRVIYLTKKYNEAAGTERVFFMQVTEQSIMEWYLEANRNGHITCTQGGEGLAGLAQAVKEKIVKANETAIVDATAHALKFSNFQNLYFEQKLPKEFSIKHNLDFINLPSLVMPDNGMPVPSQENRLKQNEFKVFVADISQKIAKKLNLKGIL
ncbi:MAG: threonine synthase [Desulfobacteraceae bacterium]|nr:threonine synthase [Desulfobacteraceae bacterium]